MNSIDLLADILMGISIVLALVTIVAKSRALKQRHDGYRWLRVWVILVCMYVIASRLGIMLDLVDHFALGIARSEPIVIAFLAIETTHGFQEW